MNHNIGTAEFKLEPGESTKWQNHTEMELVSCIEGEVEAYNGDTKRVLRSGDSVLFKALEPHRLFNHSKQRANLRTSWWYAEPIFKLNKEEAKNQKSAQEVNYLILPSFITPNGKMHIGHLAGPVVSSDILRRALAYSKQDVTYLSGTIGYQTHVDITAKHENRSYQETALRNSQQFIQTNPLMGIGTDVFTTLESKEEFHALSI